MVVVVVVVVVVVAVAVAVVDDVEVEVVEHSCLINDMDCFLVAENWRNN